MNRFVTLFLSILTLFTVSVHAAETGLIGYVNMQVVLDESEMGKQAQQALKDKFSGRQEAFAAEEQSIRQMQQTLARDEALMSQVELDKKTADIDERILAFQKEAAQAQQELAQEQGKLGKEVLGPAEAIIEAIARERKMSVVFERRQSGLLYADPAADLTAEVIKRLDAQERK